VQVSVDKTDVRQISAAIEQHLATVEDENRPWVDAGYYLLFPFALIFVLWFRKGWTLSWCLLIVLVFSVQSPSLQAADDAGSDRPPVEVVEGSPEGGVSDPGELSLAARFWSDFLSLWFTGDQLGAIYFRLGAFDKAAVHFEDTQWKAAAYYYNESFKNAIQLYSGIDSTDSMFNLGNAYAQNQEYVKALQTYRKLLEMDPAYQSAEKNIEIIQALVDEINQMSASQQPEPGEDIGELGDEPQRADGAEREDVPQVERKQFNAEQILSDERIQEQWMRQVQKDPSRFLRVKFQMQLDEQAGAQ
jgi:Ca-activated chloride channel family protein